MKILKYIAFSMLITIFALTGCKKESGSTIVGISKIVAHPALDAVEKGIMDELKTQGKTEIVYDLQNANGQANTAKQIANKFKADGVSVAVGIATPTAQALANTMTEIPIVFSAVTDPESAGLVESIDKGAANVTGVSDMTPVKDQIEMLLKLKEIKTIGNIYTASEANSLKIANMLEDICAEFGIELVTTTVTNSSEVMSAAQTIMNKVDAIYISTDNTVVSALGTIIDIANENKIPLMSADPSSATENDVLIAYGFNYYQMGVETGKMVADILDGKSTTEMPTKFMTGEESLDLHLNFDVAREIGIDMEIFNELAENAKTIVDSNK